MTRITNLIASHLTINCRLYNCERSALTIHFVAHFDVCSQWATNTDTNWWDWLLRRLKPAPLNAFPLCSPRGHFQNLKVAAPLFFSLHKVNVSKLPRPYITKKALQNARLSSFGWKMGFEPTTKNHHIPHIINKLQQQPKSTFQIGLQIRTQLFVV